MSTEPKRIHVIGFSSTLVTSTDYDALARERDEMQALANARLEDSMAERTRLLGELDALRAQLHDVKTEFVRADMECADLRAQLRASREALDAAKPAIADAVDTYRTISRIDPDRARAAKVGEYAELLAALQSTPQLAKNEGEKT